MLALLLILAAGADDAALMMKSAADQVRSSVPATGATVRSPYRIDVDAVATTDGKARALSDDGSRCAITGARLCTHKPHTWFRTALRTD